MLAKLLTHSVIFTNQSVPMRESAGTERRVAVHLRMLVVMKTRTRIDLRNIPVPMCLPGVITAEH